LTQKISLRVIVVNCRPRMTFFRFKSYKNRNRSLHIIHKCTILEFIWNFVVNICQFFPFFFSDNFSTSTKNIDESRILICKCNLSNSMSLRKCFFIKFIRLCWNPVINNIFQIILNKQFKLSIFTHGISWIKILILPFFISWIIEIKFNCIIASGDGFYIPINEA
jgi:hypothetical protein